MGVITIGSDWLPLKNNMDKWGKVLELPVKEQVAFVMNSLVRLEEPHRYEFHIDPVYVTWVVNNMDEVDQWYREYWAQHDG